MSDLTQIGLVSYLEGRHEITSLLAVDPNADGGGYHRPAIFSAFRLHTPDIFPQVIVREIMHFPDPDPGYSGRVIREQWHVQVWDKTRASITIKKIARLIETALNEQKIPIVGTNFKYIQLISGGIPEGFDTNRKEQFVIQVYNLVHATPIPV